ncbi:MAG: hypothetical protein ACLUD0_06560 [Eubacterium ramulus]
METVEENMEILLDENVSSEDEVKALGSSDRRYHCHGSARTTVTQAVVD